MTQENNNQITQRESGPLASADTQAFELLQRKANAFSKSEFVPKAYSGKPANCIVALEMAARLNASPIAIMQNLYVVHGQPAWSASFCIATVNTCGRFSPLQYVFEGKEGSDDYGCYAKATDRQTGEELVGEKITWEMVKAEGWLSKSGSKWKTMPGQMFRYRAATFWIRAYAPEFLMGMRTEDEAVDIDTAGAPAEKRTAEQILPAANTDPDPTEEDVPLGDEPGEAKSGTGPYPGGNDEGDLNLNAGGGNE